MKKIALTLVMWCLLYAGALAQGDAPFVDGAVSLGPPLPEESPELIALDYPAHHIVLPPTVIPPESVPSKEVGTMQLQIGYVGEIPKGLLPTMSWQELPAGGYIARLEFTSQNAKGLRVQLRGSLSGGLELRVYEPGGQAVFGPYTYFPGVWEKGEEPSWWTPSIFGESIGLEFYLPPGAQTPSKMPEVNAIAYLHKGFDDDGIGPSTDCLLDSTCFPAWASEARAVAGLGLISQGNVVR